MQSLVSSTCRCNSCLSCYLLSLLSEIEASRASNLQPADISPIRQLLKEYQPVAFEINEQADSMEAFQAILSILHRDCRATQTECPCLAHQNFALNFHITCQCDCASETGFETTFAEILHVNDFFAVPDFEYKMTFVLGKKTQQELKEQSVIFNQKTITELMVQDLYRRKKVCMSCDQNATVTKYRMSQVPPVFVIQLSWAQFKPNPVKVLQMLKTITEILDLSKIYSTPQPTRHMLRGMIVHCFQHYVYLIKSPSELWHIINDEFSKPLFSGEFYDLIDFFMSLGAYPVGLFYEQTSDACKTPVIDSDHWIGFESRLYSEEFLGLRAANNLNSWTCLYCYYNENSKRLDFCGKCGKPKVSTLTAWPCTFCGLENEPFVLVCDRCSNKRFRLENYENFLTSTQLREQVTPGLVKSIEYAYDCAVCQLPIYKGQTAICVECNQRALNYKCECNTIPLCCCRFCLQKFWKCEQCTKLNLHTAQKCKGCGNMSEEMEFCTKCRTMCKKDSLADGKCGICITLGNVVCIICKQQIDLPVLFICPICDNELEGVECRTCDYEVDYGRFVCGECRKTERCPVCSIGIILDEDKHCSACFSKVENFHWIRSIG
jgi:hypothetical protein